MYCNRKYFFNPVFKMCSSAVLPHPIPAQDNKVHKPKLIVFPEQIRVFSCSTDFRVNKTPHLPARAENAAPGYVSQLGDAPTVQLLAYQI